MTELYQKRSYFDNVMLPFFICSECHSEFLPEEVDNVDSCQYCGVRWEVKEELLPTVYE